MKKHLESLERLRRLFFESEESLGRVLQNYWDSEETLQAYESLLARRIGWKWAAVLSELEERDLLPACPTLLDFGCGTGIASRLVAPQVQASRVYLHDRSPLAVEFAKRLHEENADGTRLVEPWSGGDPPPVDLLLLSHILNELDQQGEAEVLDVVRRTPLTLWVEPGARAVSRKLSEIRDRLLSTHRVLAPCPHQNRCPALLASHADWCHHFARPPEEASTDGEIVRLARVLHIDLRSLPYQFLLLQSKAVAPDGASPDLPPRILARPDIRAKEAHVITCEATGLGSVRIQKSSEPDLWKALKKHPERLHFLPLSPPS